MAKSVRTIYGANKYAALHLLFSKWIRHFAQKGQYNYVTLGGTELRDIQSLHFVDPHLIKNAVSMEEDDDRFEIAIETAKRLSETNIFTDVSQGNIFDFRRLENNPHLFFIDLEGMCALSDYHLRFAEMLRQGTLREGDTLLITSYLGRNIGWQKLFKAYDAEFRMLGLVKSESKRLCYRRAHPSFTLFRALTVADLINEIALKCVGCVEYKDTSPMAVYGYEISAGKTPFCPFVKNTPYFHTRSAYMEQTEINYDESVISPSRLN